MVCDRCRRVAAAWLDTYRDEAVCDGCCPDRNTAYGMQFVSVLVRADAERLSARMRSDQEGDRR